MWWRWMVGIIVLVFLTGAYYYYQSRWRWRSPGLDKFFALFAFESALQPAEQGIHFFMGAIFPLLVNFGMSLALMALLMGLAKEIADFFFNGYIKPRDALFDVLFWVLGGLVAPIIKGF